MKTLLKTLLVPALLLVVACEQNPTGPEAFEAEEAIAVGQSPAMLLTTSSGKSALQWADTLEQDMTTSVTVNKRGDHLYVAPGIELLIPTDAVSRRTEISITSRAGADVAFEFGPHGFQFNSPVTVRIRVSALANAAELLAAAGQTAPTGSGMVAYNKTLLGEIEAVYYAEQGGEMVEVIESFPVYLVSGLYLEFETDHFSGYALAA